MLSLQAQWRRGEPQNRESSMILMRRILHQCRSYKSSHCKLLLVMTHSQSPPVCGLHYCFSAILCLFSMWKNTKTNHCIEGGRLWITSKTLTYHLGSDEQQHFPPRGLRLAAHICWQHTDFNFAVLSPLNKLLQLSLSFTQPQKEKYLLN